MRLRGESQHVINGRVREGASCGSVECETRGVGECGGWV